LLIDYRETLWFNDRQSSANHFKSAFETLQTLSIFAAFMKKTSQLDRSGQLGVTFFYDNVDSGEK
jgi:hypothetical protein